MRALKVQKKDFIFSDRCTFKEPMLFINIAGLCCGSRRSVHTLVSLSCDVTYLC